MRRTLSPLLVGVTILAVGCGQYSGLRVERRDMRPFGAVGPALAPASGPQTPMSQRSGTNGGPASADVPSPAPDAEVVTWAQWAGMLLPRIGAPACEKNIVAVVAWAAQEGTDAGWNPLATTYEMPGSTRFNSHGVQNYASLEQGLDATVRTIENGFVAHRYGAIVAELQRCAPPMATARAIKASNWCAGCAEGRYVTGIVRLMRAAG